MTATEELRHLLDERGVGYDVRDGKAIKNTYWDDAEGRRWGYTSDESGVIKDRQLFLVHGRMDITPEQAVAATLGQGTCRDSNKRFDAWQCSECGATLLLMFDDYDEPTYSVDGVADVPRFCPNCGRRVER